MSSQGFAEVWKHEPILRRINEDFCERIAAQCAPGVLIGIGGGIGNLKWRLRRVIATDIQFASWLACIANAQRLPFAGDIAANIVMIDVLHHLKFLSHFLRKAARVLHPEERAMTWGSTLFYRLVYDPLVRMSVDSFAQRTLDRQRAYAANQALTTLIATLHRQRFGQLLPSLLISRAWFSFSTYPLSGGLRSWRLIPQRLFPYALRV